MAQHTHTNIYAHQQKVHRLEDKTNSFMVVVGFLQ